ncbi:MAG TPA: multiheme c-type cytochrome [Pyrinomonadaceae bacterium]|nr:multiheme c-type cytochrome [Pyrinomonadaceae bacterium]
MPEPSAPSLRRPPSRRDKPDVAKLFAASLFAVFVASFCLLTSRAQGPSMGAGGGTSSPTTWRPNRADAKYVGARACAKCHTEESATQHSTAMGRAAQTAETSDVLRANQRLTFRSGRYSYEITRRGAQSFYTVTDGTSTVTEPVLYSFGQGKAGQTYIFRHDGAMWETRVSFYRELKGLDWTMGYQLREPTSLSDALGRAISASEARDCFACHTTGAATAGAQLQPERLTLGVSCEACHGPGAEHVAAMEAKDFKNKRVFNPGQMGTDEMSQEFCGSCHRSAEHVMTNKPLNGLVSVRFQPYRIFTSSGHDPDDRRLGCTACHNPHEDPKEEAAFYDSKCAACHRSPESLKSAQLAKSESEDGREAKPCPVSQKACVTCHMPKVEVPGTHFKFTDHRIRVAREGEPFPN